jgi:oxalate decarboxylase/phosphoglucose isomerase-like protein (cupin superfamily)
VNAGERGAGERGFIAGEGQAPWEYGLPRDGDTAAVCWRTLVSADRTPTAGVTFGVCEVPPGAQLHPHHHRPAEVYYVTAGEAEVLMYGEWRVMRPGDVGYHPGDAVHAIRNTGPRTFVLVYAFPADAFSDIEYVDD